MAGLLSGEGGLYNLGVRRNIWIAYVLAFCFHAWFWLGNWIFYYLRFGGYDKVMILDGMAVTVTLVMEIPTGVVGDLLGKRKTLLMAFLLQGLGNLIMGGANSFWMLAFGLWFLVNVGGAFYSGTAEAFVYDSLLEGKDEDKFHKVISNVRAIRLLAMAGCGFLGGFLYLISPGLPFIMDGVFSLVGALFCLAIKEPHIDSAKYSLASFFIQSREGVRTLFGSRKMIRLSLFVITTGAFGVYIYQLLDDLLAVEYGYSPQSISNLFAIACLVAGVMSAVVPRVWKKMNIKFGLIVTMGLMALALMLSPIVGMYVGALLLMFRVILEVVNDNVVSLAMNENIESGVRATTLSTLNLLMNIPYSTGAMFLGGLVAGVGARNFAVYFGLILLMTVIVLGWFLPKKNPSLRTG